jgi:glycerate kinase
LSRMSGFPTIVVAPNSFKGSLSAFQAAAAMERGILRAIPSANIHKCSMADGGEGTLDALLSSHGHRDLIPVRGADGAEKIAAVGEFDDGIAVIEVAQIVGITDPIGMATPVAKRTTLGVGDAIKALLDRGYRQIRIALGGSSTNDGGAGMLVALGARLLDRHGLPLAPTPEYLNHVATIDVTDLDQRLADCKLLAMADVQNCLTGAEGATFIFGPQKGVSPAQLESFDAGIARFAACLETALAREASLTPGSGAAGGLGFAVRMLGGELRSGAGMIADLLGLDSLLSKADWVLTGEGRSDSQTLRGKAPHIVSERARQQGISVTLLSGAVDGQALSILNEHFAGCFSLVSRPMDLDTALQEAETLLANEAEQLARVWALSQRIY